MSVPDVLPLFNTQSPELTKAFEDFARSILVKGLQGMLDEFNKEFRTYRGIKDENSNDAFKQNMPKNRYEDVPCRDKGRIILTDRKGEEYIHANLIKGDPLQTSFIATQGTLQTTIYDFWRLIEHCRIEIIVMLCAFVEKGEEKCAVYYPRTLGETMTLKDIKVTCVGVQALDQHFDRTHLRLILEDGTKRDVRHYYFKTWPDKKVPKSAKSILRLLTYIRSKETCTLVHCSAGIGRTGVFIATEMCLHQLMAKGRLSILEIAKKLRDQRAHSIQKELQYVCLAMMVLDYGVSLRHITDPVLIEQFEKFRIEFKNRPDPSAEKTEQASRVKKATGSIYGTGEDLKKKEKDLRKGQRRRRKRSVRFREINGRLV